MDIALIQAAYIIAALLFIMSLAGLSRHETARDGDLLGMVGMGIALVATLWLSLRDAPWGNVIAVAVAVAMAIGAAIGIWRARRVEMTGMPELIAMLHSFVGAAAVLVGLNTFLASEGIGDSVHLVEIFLGVFIGAVTFTGSIVAFLKLSARISSRPLMLPN